MLAALTCIGLMVATCVQSELTVEFIHQSPRLLLLTCSTGKLPRGTHIVSIKINNGTSSNGDTLAWMASNDGIPKFGEGKTDNRFLSGLLLTDDLESSRLQLLLLDHNSSKKVAFGCVISVLKRDMANVDLLQFDKEVEIPVITATQKIEDEKESTPAPRKTTKSPEPVNDPPVRTSSVLQPTVLDAGIPMSVVIVMLVLITLLLVVTSALLLQKFRGRCCAHPVTYPPSHYTLAPEELAAWEERLGSIKGSRPSIQNTVALRSHYSLPRPLRPPPPPPKHHFFANRDGSEYAGGSCSNVPAGMTRSFHYTAPFDAIVTTEEDGELSLLNTSAHCDVTPSLPPELAGESAYKVPRVEAEVQTQGQGHSLYGVSLSGSTFNLE